MQLGLATSTTAAAPGLRFPVAELHRATDRLLDAAADGEDVARAAAEAAVAELADWCAVDLIEGEELRRVARAEAAGLDLAATAVAIPRFAPDPLLVRRLELAGRPVRIEDPDWLPRHRAIAAAIGGGGAPLGCLLALVPLRAAALADQLWFAGELGHRLGQVLDLSPSAAS